MRYDAQGFRARCYSLNGINHSSKDIVEIGSGSYFALGSSVKVVNNNTIYSLITTGLSASGQILWQKSYGSINLQYTNMPNTLRTSCKVGSSIFYAGGVKQGSKFNGVLTKFALNGDTLWQKYYSDISSDISLKKVSPSCDGGFLLTGYLSDYINGESPCIIIKTDSNGKELWRKVINKLAPNVSDGMGIVQDTLSKKIVVVGFQRLGTANVWANYDNIIILDSLGAVINQTHFNTGYASDIIQTKDKKIVVVGSVEAYNGSIPLYHSYALKFDINSPNSTIWRINNFGPLTELNSFYNVVELPNGNLIFGGVLDSLKTVNYRINGLSRFVWANSSGQILKVKYYDYASNQTADNIQAPICLNNTSDGGWITSVICQNNTNNPMMYVKYDSNGCDSNSYYCANVGMAENNIEDIKFRVYPNPFFKSFSVESLQAVKIQIYNQCGSLILEKEVKASETEFNGENLTNGIYTLKVSSANKELYCKLVKIL